MRAYTVDVAALALQVDRKFLDNLLSHHEIPGCIRLRQGVRRRLTGEAIARLAVVVTLARDLGTPLARAVQLAGALQADGECEVGPDLRLTLDLRSLERTLAARLALAVESAREPRRGRPPRRAARTRSPETPRGAP